ncbi:MAG: hypothetical protein KDD37_09785 [Bdellovibrionales bacterium]|nr:hypothetical protein [Bdellovibrionales bacterium]
MKYYQIFLLVIFLLSTGCSSAINAISSSIDKISASKNFQSGGSSCQAENHRPLNIAHRGNESEWVENSIPSFLSAAQARADLVELDVVYTKDDAPIVFHDQQFNRQVMDCGSNQNKYVRELTYDQITSSCKYNTNYLPDNTTIIANPSLPTRTIPTLEHVLNAMVKTDTGVLIELKSFAQRPNPAIPGVVPVPTNIDLKVLDLLASRDPERVCAGSSPPASAMAQTFNCFQKIQIMSFDTGVVDQLYHAAKTDPRYASLKNIKFIKLVWQTPEYIQRLANPQYQNTYWNTDGVGFSKDLGEGTYDETRLKDFLENLNCNFAPAMGKLKYIYTVTNVEEIESIARSGASGVVTSKPYLYPLWPGEASRPLAALQAQGSVFAAGYIQDIGRTSGPSRWEYTPEGIVQLSNILGPFGPQNQARMPYERGTQFLLGLGRIHQSFLPTNFKISTTVKNFDNDGVGIVFNRENSSSSYIFEWDREIHTMTLYRTRDQVVEGNTITNGTILATLDRAYEINQDYHISITREDDRLQVVVDNEIVFDLYLPSVDPSPLGLQHGGWAGPLTRGHQALFKNFRIDPIEEDLVEEPEVSIKASLDGNFISDLLLCPSVAGNNPTWPTALFCKTVTLQINAPNKPSDVYLGIFAKRADGSYTSGISCHKHNTFLVSIPWIQTQAYTFEVHEIGTDSSLCNQRLGPALDAVTVQPQF